jgi:Flp pilus assembly protein TadD
VNVPATATAISATLPHPARRFSPAAAGALIAIAALVGYANSFSVPFLFDDIPAIVDNPSLRHLWPIRDVLFPHQPGGATVAGRPLVSLTLALNYAISGSSVWSYHAVNLLIHIGAALLLFGIVRRTFISVRSTTTAAFFIALIWAVHPLQTESVTYIVQRAEALLGFFYLLLFYAFLRSVHPDLAESQPASHSRRWRILAVVACAGGMASKEVMVTAPLMLFLFDRAFIAGSFSSAWRERRGFYLSLAGTWVLLAIFIASTGGNRGGTVGFGVGVTPLQYFLTQFHAISRYLRLTFWPHPLIFDYGTFWAARAVDILPYAALTLPLALATVWATWRHPRIGFAGAWFFGILAPTSLTPGTIQMIVEHRMYLPLAGVLALAMIALFRASNRIATWTCGIAAVACISATIIRNSEYQDEVRLWTVTIAERPENSMAQNNLGLALFRRGRVDEAFAHYREAIRSNPTNLEARYNLALASMHVGRFDDALREYEEILRLKPDFAAGHNNYGAALLKTGRTDNAAAEFRRALQLDPNLAIAHLNLGEILLQSDRVAEATTELETAARLDPTSAEARFNLGNALAAQDRFRDAIAHYELAIQLQPRNAEFHVNAGNALLQLDQVDAAAKEYKTALQFDPASADAHNNLGLILLHTHKISDAITHFEKALQSRPAFPAAQQNLTEARRLLSR